MRIITTQDLPELRRLVNEDIDSSKEKSLIIIQGENTIEATTNRYDVPGTVITDAWAVPMNVNLTLYISTDTWDNSVRTLEWYPESESAEASESQISKEIRFERTVVNFFGQERIGYTTILPTFMDIKNTDSTRSNFFSPDMPYFETLIPMDLNEINSFFNLSFTEDTFISSVGFPLLSNISDIFVSVSRTDLDTIESAWDANIVVNWPIA